jgi:hypothetical protein
VRIQWKGGYGVGSGPTEPDLVGASVIQITPQILVAIEAVDGRKGIDSLARLCEEKLQADPFPGCLFLFRSRHGTSIRILVYDGKDFGSHRNGCRKGASSGGRMASSRHEHWGVPESKTIDRYRPSVYRQQLSWQRDDRVNSRQIATF